MKNRLRDKKAGIVILISLILISLADIIFRAFAISGQTLINTANLGEQVAVIALAVAILILTATGKDRASYLLYGAWIFYFVIDQIFELPGMITSWVAELYIGVMTPLVLAGYMMTILSAATIIALGALLIEYMNDGSIYNRAFNVLCVVTVVLTVVSICIDLFDVINNGSLVYMLAAFNKMYRVAMVFLFAFFAYDSAKLQLKKSNLSE